MITIKANAKEQLKTALLEKVYDSSIGFRVQVSKDDDGKIVSGLKFCGKIDGDLEQDVEGIKIFFNKEADELLKNYTLEFLSGHNGGFYLVKNTEQNN
jgi:Fe-S cluster assembly iron-binding protein IscA